MQIVACLLARHRECQRPVNLVSVNLGKWVSSFLAMLAKQRLPLHQLLHQRVHHLARRHFDESSLVTVTRRRETSLDGLKDSRTLRGHVGHTQVGVATGCVGSPAALVTRARARTRSLGMFFRLHPVHEFENRSHTALHLVHACSRWVVVFWTRVPTTLPIYPIGHAPCAIRG